MLSIQFQVGGAGLFLCYHQSIRYASYFLVHPFDLRYATFLYLECTSISREHGLECSVFLPLTGNTITGYAHST